MARREVQHARFVLQRARALPEVVIHFMREQPTFEGFLSSHGAAYGPQ